MNFKIQRHIFSTKIVSLHAGFHPKAHLRWKSFCDVPSTLVVHSAFQFCKAQCWSSSELARAPRGHPHSIGLSNGSRCSNSLEISMAGATEQKNDHPLGNRPAQCVGDTGHKDWVHLDFRSHRFEISKVSCKKRKSDQKSTNKRKLASG